MTAHPQEPEPDPRTPRGAVPEVLAQQLGLIRGQLEPTLRRPGADLVRYVDVGLLNLCELAQVSMELLNRIMAMRTAAEQLGQAVDRSGRGPDSARDALLARALAELSALEDILAEAAPSASSLARGLRW